MVPPLSTYTESVFPVEPQDASTYVFLEKAAWVVKILDDVFFLH